MSALVGSRLRRMGIEAEAIAREQQAMEPVVVAPTVDRSVLGIMVDFAKVVPFYLESGEWNVESLAAVEDLLAETPCYAGRPGDGTIFPNDRAPALLRAKWLGMSRHHRVIRLTSCTELHASYSAHRQRYVMAPQARPLSSLACGTASLMEPMLKHPRVVYQQGDHVCTLFSSADEQLAAATDYIEQGLARNERCLYICGEQTPADFRRALMAAGIDVPREEARGALILLTKETAHLAGGSFNATRMIGLLSTAVEDALRDGFEGLCAAGDMTWLIDEAPGSEELAEYEALLNHFYASNRALGLCQYNRRRLPARMLDHGIATHPTVRIGGPILLTNPFYERPEEAAHRVAEPDRVNEKIERLSAAAFGPS